jgi:hypothetical protein
MHALSIWIGPPYHLVYMYVYTALCKIISSAALVHARCAVPSQSGPPYHLVYMYVYTLHYVLCINWLDDAFN